LLRIFLSPSQLLQAFLLVHLPINIKTTGKKRFEHDCGQEYIRMPGGIWHKHEIPTGQGYNCALAVSGELSGVFKYVR
jgi:hypothetical protein